MATRETNDPNRDKAWRLYNHLDYSFKEIARELGKSERTISRWAEDDKWRERKAAEASGPERLCSILLQENLAIAEGAKAEGRRMNSKEADIVYKNAATMKSLKKDVNLLTATAVFKRFNNWLVEANPDLAKQNTQFQRRFLTILAGE